MLNRTSLALCISLIAIPAFAVKAIAETTKGEERIVFRADETVTSRRFSVDYPSHWTVTQTNNDYVIIFNQPTLDVTITDETTPYVIKTDVTIQPNSLKEAILGFGSESNDIQRIEIVMVNGRPGLRIWEESEGWDFPNSLVTYIPVNDREIASIVSFYDRENQTAESAIIQMHNTLRVFF